MDQDRNSKRDDRPNRSSNMEQAEGSRESSPDTGAMRSRVEEDLGTSSDRAMFDDRESAEERDAAGDASPAVRGTDASRGKSRGNAGGITNRPLDREQHEQEQLPERGRSQSDSER